MLDPSKILGLTSSTLSKRTIRFSSMKLRYQRTTDSQVFSKKNFPKDSCWKLMFVRIYQRWENCHLLLQSHPWLCMCEFIPVSAPLATKNIILHSARNSWLVFPKRRITKLVFLPQLNTINVSEACKRLECRTPTDVSSYKGFSLSKGTKKIKFHNNTHVNFCLANSTI